MKNIKMNVWKQNMKTVALLLLLASSVQAENPPAPPTTPPTQPTSPPTVPTVQVGPTTRPPVQGGFYSDPNAIQNNLPEDVTSGREQKANDATNQSNSGQGAAIGAGAALMGASAAAFAALNIPLGVTLATMGAMEFAQAGADSGTAGQNAAQENMLRAESGQTGQQSAYDPAAQANAMMQNPAIVAGLAAAGVTDPTEFLNGVASGEMNTPEEVLAAMGQSGNFTTEQIAAMGDPSTIDMAGITGQEGNAAAATLGMVESSNTVPTASAKGMAGSGSSFGSGSGDGANGANGANGESLASTAHGKGKNGAGASLGTNGEAAGSFDGFGKGKDAASFGAAIAIMDRAELKGFGILKPHGKQTIFQIASRNYKSFQSWRKSKLRKQPVAPTTTQVAKANNAGAGRTLR